MKTECNLRMTFLFVCVPEDVVGTALDVADERDWEITQATFVRYISAQRRPHMPDAMRSGDCCVAFIDFDKDAEQAAAAAHYLQQVFNHRVRLVAVAERTEPDSLLNAIRAGCTDFLDSSLHLRDGLHQVLGHVAQFSQTQHTAPHRAGTVLALLGAKGGVGTTTLGVHLAVYLVQHCSKKVLLIDSKAQFGHVCIYLGLDGSECHFQEVVSNINRLDSELLRAFVGHHGSGLDLLSSPDVGQTARSMHPDDVISTLDFLRGEYDFVIVDCDDSSDEITRATISASSQLYLVATPDITAIRDLSRHVDDLSKLESASGVQVVINRYSSQFAVGLDQIEKAIRMPVTFSVPNNYVELVRSANLGEPVGCDVKSGFTVEILKWAHSLVGEVTQTPQPNPRSAGRKLWRSVASLLPSFALTPTSSSTGKRA